jgi:hypothetical protein
MCPAHPARFSPCRMDAPNKQLASALSLETAPRPLAHVRPLQSLRFASSHRAEGRLCAAKVSFCRRDGESRPAGRRSRTRSESKTTEGHLTNLLRDGCPFDVAVTANIGEDSRGPAAVTKGAKYAPRNRAALSRLSTSPRGSPISASLRASFQALPERPGAGHPRGSRR